MKKLYVALILVFSIFPGGANADRAGGGGDNPTPDHGSAWFLGRNKIIKYCVEISPDFGVSKSEAQKTVEDVFAQWKSYITSKHWFDDPITYVGGFPTGFNLATNVVADSCKNADLTFYMGVTTPQVDHAKKRYENPTSFAQRTSYDINSGWGGGFIWVAGPGTVLPKNHFPDWTKQNILYGDLLHEVGHVLGTTHIPGTIMTEDISAFLLQTQADASYAQLRKIDWSNQVSHCLKCTETYENRSDSQYADAQIAAAFKVLLGRLPKGKGKEIAFVSRNHAVNGLKLKLTDDAGSYTFDFHFTEHYTYVPNIPSNVTPYIPDNSKEDYLRKAFYQFQKDFFNINDYQSVVTYNGYFVTSGGKKISAILELNMDNPPVKITGYDSGKNPVLFASISELLSTK